MIFNISKMLRRSNCCWCYALRRASMKFPGKQVVMISKQFGFSHLTHYQYHKYADNGMIKGYGSFCRVLSKRGPLSNILDDKKKKH